MKRETKIRVAIAVVAGVACLLLLPGLRRDSNCGGNSAALAACESYAKTAVLHAMNEPDGLFSADRLTPSERALLGDLPGRNWLRTANFLVRVGELTASEDNGSRTIIIVCDRAYDNVPQRFIRKVPLSHAVGYSTGEAGLISVQEFAQLDLSRFAELDRLYE